MPWRLTICCTLMLTPPVDSKVRVRRQERQCGGLTGTALVAAARLGMRCAYAGLLGDDDLSRFVAGALESEGVDLAYAVRRSDARPAHSTIIVGCQHRTRTIYSLAAGKPDAPRLSNLRRSWNNDKLL